ncbi:MAG: hypothetical protein ACI4KA_07470 [Oscillospiraceae bacterium]
MKKILSLGVAAAVLSLTAIAASAAIAPVITNDAVEGETITVEVIANGMTLPGTQFSVVASENLTLVEGVAIGGGFFANNTFAWASTEAAADGTVLLTLTYTVDGAADDDISVALTPAAGFEADVDATAAAAVVLAADNGNEDITTDEPIETTDEPIETTEDPGIIDTEDPTDTTDTSEENTNVPTGIALAVAPAMLAGAAIVVAKKRK